MWPPIGKIAAHLGFWSGNLFLIAPFPDLCLLVPFYLPIEFQTEVVLNFRSLKLWASRQLHHQLRRSGSIHHVARADACVFILF